ncbi:hypothetical protein C799_03586 [Bacteroides thetaiotaomicron dnLKV9]|jgi:hypothetical protein|uniref:Uncharacterized protein n=2 Tax=Bacteroides thetaiotaomicron TaxID=818 RepID=A0A174LDX1_BACT4|nr:hypothetical protein [Bacteroides thetaiotaomicron]EOR99704.1 hypothetical protein C799_03586 [Bacteroides thetaiotaomicron dnLKV9]MCS2646225.1 hypothetical protein [Bacteroides thetaiotaomicron]CUP20717.1 Uncharacterised protein [Bacteroides thetaiotaomicron]
MKRNIFIALAAFVICSSCSDSYYLPETEQDLAQLNSEYDDVKAKEADDEGEKIETLASEDEIKASMDEYKAELMNRESVAKERVMRTAYAAVGGIVGVFKISSCGTYKELRITMDCEDKKSDSYTTGNVGASYVENGNVNFVFCLTNANRYYPGGVLLVDHIDYNLTLTQDSRREVRKMDAIVRHHDTEDSDPRNRIYTENADYQGNLRGYSSVDNDVTLAWGFPSNGAPFSIASYFGAAGIQYGLLSTTNAATGTIRCDDEDKNNKNWIQRYNLGYTLDSGFNESIALGDFGITANGNTTYSVSLSTDAKFSKNNRFYPSRLY